MPFNDDPSNFFGTFGDDYEPTWNKWCKVMLFEYMFVIIISVGKGGYYTYGNRINIRELKWCTYERIKEKNQLHDSVCKRICQ